MRSQGNFCNMEWRIAGHLNRIEFGSVEAHLEMRRHTTHFAKKDGVPLHEFVRLFTTGGGASMKPGSLVKKGTLKSWVDGGVPGPLIEGAGLKPLLARLAFEDLVGATVLACLRLSRCLPLRAAK